MDKKPAILGGTPAFQVPVAKQNYLPDWERFTGMIDGIFSRKYYTNHGPLAQELEKKLAAFFEVKHTICMTNTGIGTMIAVKAMGLKGKVIIPAFAPPSLSQAVVWAGLEPVFCDVDENTLHLDTRLLESKIDADTVAVLGVNLFGGTCHYPEAGRIADRHGIRHFYLSTDAAGACYDGTKTGNFGSMEIFSLHESNIINSTDGCVITTNDDHIAARLRNIRSSYGAGVPVPIEFTGNGRMSEVQAGMAILTLEKYRENADNNKENFQRYESFFGSIDRDMLFRPQDIVTGRNYQRVVVRIEEKVFGMNAACLAKSLRAENIHVDTFTSYARSPFSPFDSLSGMPNALRAASSLLEFPVLSGSELAGRVLDVLNRIRSESKTINQLYLQDN